MAHQCYLCRAIFDSKEELYEHLDTHSKTGLSPLSDEEIIEHFNDTKSGETTRMSAKS